jgi:hypothetical protein
MEIHEKYKSLPLPVATRIAHEDFINCKDHMGFRPAGSEEVFKLDAVDFLRHVADENPELITVDVLKDFEAEWDKCNSASRLGIIEILKNTKRPDSIPFLKKIVSTADIVANPAPIGSDGIIQGEWHREEAQSALESLQKIKK